MLLNQQSAAANAVDKPSVGSLFVPTRPQSLQRPSNKQTASTTCRIAGLQRQPMTNDLDFGVGLLLPQQQPVKPAPVRPAVAEKKRLRLSWAGSGVYFWWQLGAVQYLMQHFQLSKVPMVGASGGALAAVLASCEVDPQEVMESAYRMSLQHNIWEKPLGLMGCWGERIEEWLDELLPADAAARCRDQVGIVVTQLPRCNQVAISDFRDKKDLINVAMASAHVPLFLDWKVSRQCRGVQCVDGSFPDFFTNENCDLLKCDGDAVIFDYFMVSIEQYCYQQRPSTFCILSLLVQAQCQLSVNVHTWLLASLQ
eukprot:GHRR01004739.1.p1 GENE.GHRR01004739.1~~GHRR01004739.1.p1  ORF type:complete len:311 (+),score=93.02 GHRR01004739.1:181-1113(+)